MLEFAEEPKALIILNENGKPLTAGDNERRFFEASWMHKYNGKYYFPTLPVIRIVCATPLAIILTVLSLIRALSLLQ